ncbi:MAG: metal dependent phosphohydrolase, partial [Capsulimonas sp.]|nr:metal dependent phosphohydrolase [Capsulimonas sp.]
MDEAAAGRPIIVEDTQYDPRTAPRYESTYLAAQLRSFIAVPFVREGKWIRALCVSMREPHAWSRAEIDLLAAVAERTWLSWDNARWHKKAEDEANQRRIMLQDVLSSVTEGKLILCDSAADLPHPDVSVGEITDITASDIRTVRYRACEAAKAAGLPDDRADDLLTAVGEAGMNAVVHAGGGQGSVHITPEQAVQVWIKDSGAGISLESIPKATLKRGHSTAGTFGHGFWLMLSTVDRLWLLTGVTGTTLVLEQNPTPPPPSWLQ